MNNNNDLINDNLTNEEIEAKIITNENIIEEEKKAIEYYEEVQQDIIIIEEQTATNDFLNKFKQLVNYLPIQNQKIDRLLELQEEHLKNNEAILLLQKNFFNNTDKKIVNVLEEIEKIKNIQSKTNEEITETIEKKAKISEETQQNILKAINKASNNDNIKTVEQELKKQKIFNIFMTAGLIITISLLSFIAYTIKG
jgi:hypothetical protein